MMLDTYKQASECFYDSDSDFLPRVQRRPPGHCCLTSKLSYSSLRPATLYTNLYYNLLSAFLALLNYTVQENKGRRD